jgi:hypothetical protein
MSNQDTKPSFSIRFTIPSNLNPVVSIHPFSIQSSSHMSNQFDSNLIPNHIRTILVPALLWQTHLTLFPIIIRFINPSNLNPLRSNQSQSVLISSHFRTVLVPAPLWQTISFSFNLNPFINLFVFNPIRSNQSQSVLISIESHPSLRLVLHLPPVLTPVCPFWVIESAHIHPFWVAIECSC